MPTSLRPQTSWLFRPIKDPDLTKNFETISSFIAQLGPACNGLITDKITLAVGDNSIPTTIPKPTGRITVFQSAAATITDKGLDLKGKWVVTSTAICVVKFLFI